MQTPTHTLLAFVFLSKANSPARNWAIFIGSLIPDAFIYIAYVGLRAKGVPGKVIWNDIYFDQPMQNIGAFFNSAPLYAGLALAGWGLAAKTEGGLKTAGRLALFFALAALIHLATDFPVHADDAHRHFWPLSDWRFHSPISYWDPDHHGAFIGALGALIDFVCIAILWRRFNAKWVRILLSVLAVLTAAVLCFALLFQLGLIGGSR